MKIAITGANGFLGSHLVKASLAVGHETIALVRSGADLSLLPADRKLMIKTIDYQSYERIHASFLNLVRDFDSFDFLIHNAGLTVATNPIDYQSINTELTRQLLRAAKETNSLNRQGKWIQISSYAANGPSDINQPVSAYGQSKLAAEKLVSECGFNFQIFRPTGIYGSGDKAFLPLFKTASLGFYPMLAPSDQRITMVHGKDVACTVIKNLHGFKHQPIVHLSDGRLYTHLDFKLALEKATGKKLKKLKVPIYLTKNYLKFSDLLAKRTKMTPPVTLEKYEEISQHWDLSKNEELFHPTIDCHFDLFSGFEETYQYYKSVNLLK